MQEEVDRVRKIVQGFPMIAALKQVLATGHGDAEWRRVRAPLSELSAEQAASLTDSLAGVGFSLLA